MTTIRAFSMTWRGGRSMSFRSAMIRSSIAGAAVIVVLQWEDALLGLVADRAHGLLTPLDRTRLTHVLGRWDGPHLVHTLETEGRRVHVLDLDGMFAELAERI